MSGHRRWLAAQQAGVLAVEIKVVLYNSEKQHRMDGSLLNRNRDKLSPLEAGHELKKLRQLGWTIKQISESYGMSAPLIYARINLTKLDPEILKKMDPSIPRRSRLAVTTAGALGGIPVPSYEELEDAYAVFSEYCDLPEMPEEEASKDEMRFCMQRYLLSVITKRNLVTVRALEFIQNRKVQLKSYGRQWRQSKPRRQRESKRNILLNWISSISNTVVMDWQPKEIRKALEYLPREEIDVMLADMDTAKGLLEGMEHLLKKIRDEKKPTPPDVIMALKK